MSFNTYLKKLHLKYVILLLICCFGIKAKSSTGTASKAASAMASFQQSTVRGKVSVKGSDSLSTIVMPGVIVSEKGTKNSVITNANGEFQLNVSPGAALTFSLIGYRNLEIPVNGKTYFEVILDQDVSNLEEVVITGYQTINKRLFTGAATTLGGEEAKRDGMSDVSRMLEGRVAGVSVQNVSGTFGAAPKIRVRGATSITGDNKPLWVVDGIVLEDVVNISNEQLSTGDPATMLGSSVAGLNPDDIESFQILKDAAATSLYGARAMNGVIVITTKKGRIGNTLVSYTGNYSTYLKPAYTSFDIMNSYDQMSIYAEMQRKGWLNYSDVSRSQDGGVFTKMADMITNSTLLNTPEARAEFLQKYARANTDWFDILFKNSFMQEHSLSVQSGSEKSQVYYSTSYLNDNGWSVSDKVQRFTGNIRANWNLSDRIKLGLITQGTIREQKAPGSLGRSSNPVTGEYSRDFDINPFSYALNTSRTITAFDENGNREYFTRNYAPFNILSELENNTIDLSLVDMKVQGEFSYTFPNSLKYTFDGSYRYAKTSQEHKVRENSNMALAYRAAGDATIRANNRFLYRDPDNPEAEPVVVLPAGGFYGTDDDYLVNYFVRNSLDWSKTLNNIHTVRLFASQELRYADRQSKTFTGFGYQYDKGGVPFVDPKIIKQAVEGNFNYYDINYKYDRFIAMAVNAAYSYKRKYNINGTVRYDGSNLLGESRQARWLPTWNISGSWNADEENFIKNQSVISRMVLRATYGLTASMGNATNSSLVLKSSSTLRPYLSEVESAISIASLENSGLTWEKQYETNLGIDIGLFDDKLNLTADVYNRDGFDLIGPVRTSGIGGESIKIANYANMNTQGLEASLAAELIQARNFGLRTQLTFGYNKGIVLRLRNEPTIWDLMGPEGGPKLGYPYRGIFSIDFQQLNPENGSPEFINEKGQTSGNVYLQSTDVSHLKYEGPVDPTYTGGWYNAFKYKNFNLSALLTFSGGNKIRLSPVYKSKYTDLDAMPYEFLERWTLPGDEKVTNIPSILDLRSQAALGASYPYNAYNYSTARVVDGAFVRLKQVSLGYTLPSGMLSKLRLNNMSLTLSTNNLWLIYADKRLHGQDPEFFSSGGVAMPLPRQFTLSLKAGI